MDEPTVVDQSANATRIDSTIDPAGLLTEADHELCADVGRRLELIKTDQYMPPLEAADLWVSMTRWYYASCPEAKRIPAPAPTPAPGPTDGMIPVPIPSADVRARIDAELKLMGKSPTSLCAEIPRRLEKVVLGHDSESDIASLNLAGWYQARCPKMPDRAASTAELTPAERRAR